MSYETESYVANRMDRIKALEYEVKVLKMALISHGEIVEENARLRGGYKGSCLTCEWVGELNEKLEKENAELKERLNKIEWRPTMGTDLENVLEEIESLIAHLKYFSECRGNYSKEIQTEINVYSRLLTSFARIIEESTGE